MALRVSKLKPNSWKMKNIGKKKKKNLKRPKEIEIKTEKRLRKRVDIQEKLKTVKKLQKITF